MGVRQFVTTTDMPSGDPRFGPWGKQKCEDIGPLTTKRMETIDDEFAKATIDFIDGREPGQETVLRLVLLDPTALWIRLTMTCRN